MIFIFILCATFTLAAQQFQNNELYRFNAGPQYTYATAMIKNIKSIQHPNALLLDVGCGDGNITTQLLPSLVPNGYVIGIDSSESMIYQANKAIKNSCLIHLECNSIEKYDTQDCFDIVTSFSTLHWVKNIEQALANIYNALRTNGKGYFVIGAKYDEDKLVQAVEQQTCSSQWASYFKEENVVDSYIYLYTQPEMQNLLEQAKFTVELCTTQDTKYTFTSIDSFCTWLEAASPYSKNFNDPLLHRAFCMDVVKTYATLWNQDHKSAITYYDCMLYVIVQKLVQ